MKKYKITEAQILRGDTSGTWGLFSSLNFNGRDVCYNRCAAGFAAQGMGWPGSAHADRRWRAHFKENASIARRCV